MAENQNGSFDELWRKMDGFASDLKAAETHGSTSELVSGISGLFYEMVQKYPEESVKKDVARVFWVSTCYRMIERSRKMLTATEKRKPMKNSKVRQILAYKTAEFIHFLEKMLGMLSDSLGLQLRHNSFVIPPSAVVDERDVNLLLLQRVLIFIGDLERHSQEIKDESSQSWNTVLYYYKQASLLYPSNGNPYNQIGIVYLRKNDISAMYHFYRGLCVPNEPFELCSGNLNRLFESKVKKCNFDGAKHRLKQTRTNWIRFTDYLVVLIGLLHLNRFDDLQIIQKTVLDHLDSRFSKHILHSDSVKSFEKSAFETALTRFFLCLVSLYHLSETAKQNHILHMLSGFLRPLFSRISLLLNETSESVTCLNIVHLFTVFIRQTPSAAESLHSMKLNSFWSQFVALLNACAVYRQFHANLVPCSLSLELPEDIECSGFAPLDTQTPSTESRKVSINTNSTQLSVKRCLRISNNAQHLLKKLCFITFDEQFVFKPKTDEIRVELHENSVPLSVQSPQSDFNRRIGRRSHPTFKAFTDRFNPLF